MAYRVTVLPAHRQLTAEDGDVLLALLRREGLLPEAPCGGQGTCGKCKVTVDGREVLACRTAIHGDMTVTVPQASDGTVLTRGIAVPGDQNHGYCLAFDIGTTTVAGWLLAPGGKELAHDSALNPQVAFGADVISRIRHSLDGEMAALTDCIRRCADKIARALCQRCGVFPEQIETICLVGNPGMQQLFLGIEPRNLACLPFAPVLTQAERVAAVPYFPNFPNATLWNVPDISGFVGADTVACILATGMDTAEEMTLLVDIGTNGELVLGNRHRMVACSTAAGPALEGANIRYGMRAQAGAIDHVWPEGDGFGCSVIGGGEAVGICGSGLVDAVAAALNADLLNERGRIQNEAHIIRLTENVYLTQDDIRQVQTAKGAIAAGIELMAEHLGISLDQIRRVCLAGAFGSFLEPHSALRIGLLPQELLGKLAACGNAAGSGAKLLLQQADALERAQRIADSTEHLELAALPGFQRRFADCMRFTGSIEYWCRTAKILGFAEAASLDVATLEPREEVRAMCAADKCGAYGKNWTCPPHCGTLAACAAKLRSYRRGILLQTVGQLEKAIDTRGYRRTEQQHLTQLHALAELMALKFPGALFLGSGGCRICKQCAYPAPCRFPEKACSSMEGYGLFVTQVCRDNGLAYHHGEKTVTYTACVLF